uniref:Uncharacterized protein n=1 Tax=viral metagenome TaxID=1070528 RepID=A0A6M3JCU7_9ZZZZ
MNINERLSELLGVPERDWTSSDGKIELLRTLIKREDWPAFVNTIGSQYINIYHYNTRAVDVDIILDTTGKLRDAAIEWLEGGHHEG